MLFHTPEFLLFFAILVAALSVPRGTFLSKSLLLVASWIFYSWWNPIHLTLLFFDLAVSFAAARAPERKDGVAHRRLILAAALTATLGLLAWFKYVGLLSQTVIDLLSLVGIESPWRPLRPFLPIGISFFTFQSLSYVIDVYRRVLPASRSLFDYSLSISFFPHLVAGPIVRPADLLPQFRHGPRLQFDTATGFLFLRGLAKKVLVADNLAPLVDGVFDQPQLWPSLVIWIGTIGFAVQIYCDFSGYTDMAVALARVLGYQLPKNFEHPYFAPNPRDFWRRWHISLSSWLRDYLYISLGGNRGGALRRYRNLMITMLLGGLWHGASWSFVLWGGLHGAYLCVHHAWSSRAPAAAPTRWKHVGSVLAMQYFVLLAWIPFRVTEAEPMIVAVRKFVIFDATFDLADLGAGTLRLASAVSLIVAFAIAHTISHRLGNLHERLSRLSIPALSAVGFATGFVFYCLWPPSQPPFIYFQF